jgi:drug/metabolite transporter (DMT)-like permease
LLNQFEALENRLMEATVFIAVLAAAACHAGWNAVIKGGGDPLKTTAIVSVAAGVVGLPLWPWLGVPNSAAWIWVIASVVVHLFYFVSLIEAYRHGDLSQVYPIARGGAPLMTAAASTLLIGEVLSPLAWGGLVLLVAGVVLLSVRGGDALAKFNWRAIGFALATAVTICAYTIVDGIGARVSGNPASYTLAIFAGSSVVMVGYVLVRRGGAGFAAGGREWGIALFGGALQVISYGIAIWAMTVAPIAIVGALRETSVLFGTLIAVIVLKEPMHATRMVAALLIVAGLVALRLG